MEQQPTDIDLTKGHLTDLEYDLPISADSLDGVDVTDADRASAGELHYGKSSNEVVEKLAEQVERNENLESTKQSRIADQAMLVELCPGQILSSREFLRRLRTINDTFELNSWSAMGQRGLSYSKAGARTYTGVAVQDGYSIEWSSIYEDEHGMPGRHRYKGWREVLLSLIRSGLISEEQAHRAFGEPNGPRASGYRKKLWEHRNRREWDRD